MGQSAKALLQFAVLVLLFVALVIGCFAYPDPLGMAIVCAVLPGAGLVVAILIRASFRKDKAPDLLRGISKRYFECDGLCFAPVFEVVDGRCRISIFFQNRYRNRCECDVQIDPPERHFWVGRIAMPSVKLQVGCGGGEFGVIRTFYPIPEEYQGRTMAFDIGARTRYPEGRGELLRFSEGLRVGAPKSRGSALVSLLAVFVGVIYMPGSAKIVASLPRDVAADGPTDSATPPEILWSLDLPTHGFPVVVDGRGMGR